MDKDSTLYKLISKINRLKEIKKEFDAIAELFKALTREERALLEELVKPYYLLSDLDYRGVSMAMVESINAYELVDLDSLVK